MKRADTPPARVYEFHFEQGTINMFDGFCCVVTGKSLYSEFSFCVLEFRWYNRAFQPSSCADLCICCTAGVPRSFTTLLHLEIIAASFSALVSTETRMSERGRNTTPLVRMRRRYRSQWSRGQRHEMSSTAKAPVSWAWTPLEEWASVCMHSVFVLPCEGGGLATGWSPYWLPVSFMFS
jgi:hypothetical protein